MAMKAWALAQQCVYMWSADPRADRRQAVELAESAASLITDHTGTLVAIAAALTNASDDTSRGMPFVERALAIDPSNAWAWMRRGWLYVYEGDPEPALAAFDRAERLSPLDPFRFNICFGKAAAMRFCAGREAEALPLIEQGIAMNPRAKWALRLLVAAYYTIGRTDEANRTAREMLESYPNLTISYMRAALADTAFHRAGGYYEIFSNLGVPEN